MEKLYSNNILIINDKNKEINNNLKYCLEDTYQFKVHIFSDLTKALPYINENIDLLGMAIIGYSLNGFQCIEIATLLKKLNFNIWNVLLAPVSEETHNLIGRIGINECTTFNAFLDEDSCYDLNRNLDAILRESHLNLLNQN